MLPRHRLTQFVTVVLLCVGIDQFSKWLATQLLLGRPWQHFLGGTFSIGYAENPGAFLSLGASLSPTTRTLIFIVLVGICLIVATYHAVSPQRSTDSQALALALFVGGGGSNLIDRVWNEGRVIDFLNVGIGSVRTGIFNIADMIILAAVGWLIYLFRDTPRAASGTEPSSSVSSGSAK